MKKVLFTVAAIFCSNVAQAAWVEGKVNIIHNGGSATSFIVYWTGAPLCGSRQLIVDKVNMNDSIEIFNRSYAAVLSAIATQKPIRVETLGCNSIYSKVGSVQICNSDPCNLN